MTLGAAFPIHDWQFWVVTAIALAAAVWLLKGFIPVPWLSRRLKARKQTKSVALTIEGKAREK